MSTSINNGIKFKSKDLNQILHQLTSIREKSIEVANKSIKKNNLELFIKYNNLLESKPFDIFSEVKKSLDADYLSYNFNIRFKFSIILYPSIEGEIYAVYFSNLNEHRELLNPFVDEFEYYDNTDRPDDITDEEWESRRKRWDQMIPGKFKDSGFSFNIVSADDLDREIIQTKIIEIMSYLRRDVKLDEILKK